MIPASLTWVAFENLFELFFSMDHVGWIIEILRWLQIKLHLQLPAKASPANNVKLYIFQEFLLDLVQTWNMSNNNYDFAGQADVHQCMNIFKANSSMPKYVKKILTLKRFLSAKNFLLTFSNQLSPEFCYILLQSDPLKIVSETIGIELKIGDSVLQRQQRERMHDHKRRLVYEKMQQEYNLNTSQDHDSNMSELEDGTRGMNLKSSSSSLSSEKVSNE